MVKASAVAEQPDPTRPDPTKVGGLGSAPRFTTGARSAPSPAAAAPASRSAHPAAPPGGTLSAAEIEQMLQNAGSGCPLGPCQGCPHHDVLSHTCTA